MKKKTLFSIMFAMCLAFAPMFLLTACDKGHVHVMEYHPAVSATCETGGTVEYWHCKDCNKNYSAEKDGKELEDITTGALGHDYKNYTYNAVDKTYTGTCTHDASHLDTKPAGLTEEYPYMVSSEADFVDLGIADAQATTTIYLKLTDDIALENPVVVKRPIVLDLNKKTISYTSSVMKTMINIGNVEGKEYKTIIKNGNLTLNGTWTEGKCNLITCDYSSRVELIDVVGQSTKYGITMWEDAQVTATNTKIYAELLAVSNNNTGITKDARFIAEDCEFVSTGDTAIFVSGYMTMVINNSTIIGKTGGVHIMMGDIKITNSTITAGDETLTTLKTITAELLKQQGTHSADGSAVMIRADLYYDKNVKTNKLVLDFAGTTFASSTGVAVSVYQCNNASNYLTGAEVEANTVMNQAEYVKTILPGLGVNTKTFEYVDGVISEVTNA